MNLVVPSIIVVPKYLTADVIPNSKVHDQPVLRRLSRVVPKHHLVELVFDVDLKAKLIYAGNPMEVGWSGVVYRCRFSKRGPHVK
jgi:hypothetical protein